MQNLVLNGYAPNSTTLGPVSLADLYDPQGKTHDVVILVAGAMWDTFTGQTLTAIKGSAKRIATLAVLGEGTTPGAPATLANLATWRSTGGRWRSHPLALARSRPPRASTTW